MAYVAPNGTIELFRGIGLTPEYVDTIWFPNISIQDHVFSQIVRYSFSSQMYTRVSENKCRVHIVADEIRDCDYMRFQNTRAGKSKWFYAFITNIEYINEQVTEITYEIDEIQSWYFEPNSNNHFEKCFIERQHSESDDIGENIVPEPINVTESIVCEKAFSWSSISTKYLVAIGVVDKIANQIAKNQTEYGGLASTVMYFVFDSTNYWKFISAANFADGLIENLISGNNNLWSILSVYAVPSEFFANGTADSLLGADCILLGNLAWSDRKSAPRLTPASHHGNAQDGLYSDVKNNKMFTYPYSFIRIATPISEQDFKYENFFYSGDCYFSLRTTCNPEPVVVVFPENYNGEEFDFRYAQTINSFPVLTLYQNNMSGELMGKAVKAGLAALGGAVIGAASGGLNVMEVAQVGMLHGRDYVKNSAPLLSTTTPSIKGGGSTTFAPFMADTDFPTGAPQFRFRIDGYQMGLRAQTAELVDQYFSRYGYAQNKIDVPNVHARQKWTYVKTRDCKCTVNAPASSLAKINSIMNNGITWWDSSTSVGHYGNFNNPVIG